MPVVIITFVLTMNLLSLCVSQDDVNASQGTGGISHNKIQEAFLIPMTHLDIGFTDSLDIVAMRCKEDIDQAIEICETYGEFHFTIESIWQLEQWMLRSTNEEIDRLKKLIEEQRIEVSAMYCTLRSGLLGMEDANRLLYPMQRMQERLGISFDTAVQNDVPGYADVYPRIFASSGIKYFLTGINTGHGGGANIPRHLQPFLWQGADGHSVLTWIEHEGYVGVWPWGIYDIWNPGRGILPEKGQFFRQALEKLEKEGYPYSVFLVMSALGDNRPPREYVPIIEGVRKWNQSGFIPKLRFATPRQFFREIEGERGNRDYPAWKGNWHGLWDARLWNPAGNILGRRAQQLLPVAESLSAFNAIHDIGTYLQYDLIQGYTSLYLHCEHTCGGDPSWIGFFDPTLFRKTALRQNELTIRFAREARCAAEGVLDVDLSELAQYINAKEQGVLIFNPLQWRRNAIVSCQIPLGFKDKGVQLLDSSNDKNVDYALEGNGSELVFPAENLPALGYKWYDMRSMEQDGSKNNTGTAKTTDTIIQNQFFRINCDPKSGHIKNILDLETQRELVDDTHPESMNALVIKGHREVHGSGDGDQFISPCVIFKEKGLFFERIVIERKGSLWPLTVITLPVNLKRIDIRHILDRKRFPDVSFEDHSQYYNFVFPFRLNEADLQIYADGPDGFYSYPKDYLPGATLGAIQSQYGIHLQEGNRFGITISNKQSFNWTIGEIQFNRKADFIEEPPPGLLSSLQPYRTQSVYPLKSVIYSNVIQFATEGWTADYGRTYIRETEPGTEDLVAFEYSITTNQGGFSRSGAARFCRESVISPVARYCREGTTGTGGSLPVVCGNFLEIEPENVLMTGFKKAEFGSKEDYIIRLKELEGIQTQVGIKFGAPVVKAALCSINEIPLDSDKYLPVQPISLKLTPFGVETLRIRFSGSFTMDNGKNKKGN